MEGTVVPTAVSTRSDITPTSRSLIRPWFRGANRLRDGRLLLLLLLLTAGMRLWQVVHTEVTSRDSIGFIRYAWQLQHQEDPFAVVRGAEQHPGYPLMVLAASWPVRLFHPGPDSVAMQLSAQIASSLASVLLVIPLFLLGRDLFNRSVAFWATLLIQTLPATGELLADGLSESTFLLFAVTGWWAGLRALRGSRPGWYFLCGVSGTLAYLTRPEGALVVAFAGLILVCGQLIPMWRRSWPDCVKCGAALSLGALLLAGPFVLVTGRLTTKPTPQRLFEEPEIRPAPAQAEGKPLRVASFAVWWEEQDGGRLAWGARAILFEIMKGFNYVLWLPALAGLFWLGGRIRRDPGALIPLLVGLTVVLLMWRVAIVLGYLSDRHLVTLIVIGMFWAVAGLWELTRRSRVVTVRPEVIAVLLILLIGIGAVRTGKTLHADRAGFRAAGLWIAERLAPGDVVVDPYCWSHYYSGAVFLEGQESAVPVGHTPVQYVVLERSSNPHPRLTLVAEARRLSALGRPVFTATGSRRREHSAEVVVYAVP